MPTLHAKALLHATHAGLTGLDHFDSRSAQAESSAVTKQRAPCAERVPCCHSSGSVSNCRGAVSGVLLGGGSHECTKVRAAVTSQAQYVASEQTKLLRRFRLACPQTRDLFEGTLLDRNNTALSFGTKLCLKVLLVHLKCAKSEVRIM